MGRRAALAGQALLQVGGRSVERAWGLLGRHPRPPPEGGRPAAAAVAAAAAAATASRRLPTARPCRRRACSDATSKPGTRSRLEALTEESETAHKLFDNARLVPEASEGAAQAAHHGPGAGAAAEGAAIEAAESSGVGRAFSALGNALFFGGVAAASFFGYYTYRYDCDQVRRAGGGGGGGGRAVWGPCLTVGQLHAAVWCMHVALLLVGHSHSHSPAPSHATPQVDRMLAETEHKAENAFLGSSVRPGGAAPACAAVCLGAAAARRRHHCQCL